MDERKQTLLKHIIEAYIDSAEPIGSQFVAQKYMHTVSAATVRNEMQELAKEGYIATPHTSAGRIPTEKGWRYYLEVLLEKKELNAQQGDILQEAKRASTEVEESTKYVAKKAAELSGETMVIAFNPRNVFYTGLSHLFAKPEFSNQQDVITISEIIDHLDDVMASIHTHLDADISILLGSDNPFGNNCASVLTCVQFANERGVVGMLGPVRMNYKENIAYIKYIKQLLEK